MTTEEVYRKLLYGFVAGFYDDLDSGSEAETWSNDVQAPSTPTDEDPVNQENAPKGTMLHLVEVKAKKSEPIGAPKRIQKSSKANMQGAKPPAGPPPPPKHATRASLEHAHAPLCPPLEKARPLPKPATVAPLEHEPLPKKVRPRTAPATSAARPILPSSSPPFFPTIPAATPADPPPPPPPHEGARVRQYRGGAYAKWFTAVDRARKEHRLEEFYSLNTRPCRKMGKMWTEITS